MTAGLEPETEVNAKKETWGRTEAVALLATVSELHAARGKKIVTVDLKQDDLPQADVLKLILGPTGNLRAPTLRVGKRLIVGFHQDMYEAIFRTVD